MAKVKKAKANHWQMQADHWQKILDEMNVVIADPATTPEDKAEAQQTVIDMTAHLSRLAESTA